MQSTQFSAANCVRNARVTACVVVVPNEHSNETNKCFVLVMGLVASFVIFLNPWLNTLSNRFHAARTCRSDVIDLEGPASGPNGTFYTPIPKHKQSSYDDVRSNSPAYFWV
jgi:hypothetical protein